MKILFLLLLGISSLAAKEIDKTFNESFKVKQGGVLILEHGDGDVNISTWEKDDLDISVRYKAETGGSNAVKDFDVKFKSYGEKIYVSGTEYRDSFFNFGNNYTRHIEYIYEIKAPAYLELDINGDDGSVMIENLSGNLKINLDDGNIILRNIKNKTTDLRLKDGRLDIINLESELYINSDDGDITLENLVLKFGEIDTEDGQIKIISASGPLNLGSDDGDIILNEVSSSEIRIKTEDGDIDLEFNGKKVDDFYITTKDGRVRLYLKEAIDADADLNTDDGRLSFDVADAEIFEDSRRQIRAKIGDGSGRIRISTNDGSISLISE